MALDQVGYLLNLDDQMICINVHKILWLMSIQFDDFFWVFASVFLTSYQNNVKLILMV